MLNEAVIKVGLSRKEQDALSTFLEKDIENISSLLGDLEPQDGDLPIQTSYFFIPRILTFNF